MWLCRCWDNLKTKYKAMKGKENRERMRTGGGPADIDPPNELLDRVGAIVPFLDLVVCNNYTQGRLVFKMIMLC